MTFATATEVLSVELSDQDATLGTDNSGVAQLLSLEKNYLPLQVMILSLVNKR